MLIFLAAVSEYDQVLAEDDRTNRLVESLNLFGTILNYNWFRYINVILFLNKKDVLEEKIVSGRSPVKNYFEDFPGPDDDYQAAINYFQELFVSKNENPDERFVYPYATCATDTKNIEVVDVTVQKLIMEEILKNAGIQ